MANDGATELTPVQEGGQLRRLRAAALRADPLEPDGARPPGPLACLSWSEGHLPPGRPGGDLFAALPLDDRHVLLAIGDVSGHGASAAPRMRALHADLQRLAGHDPAAVVSRLDVRIARDGDPELLATLWVGVLDVETGLLRTANAGHPPPVVAWGGTASLLGEATAPPLGTGQVRRHVRTDLVHVPRGGLLVAYTDGAVERRGTDLEGQMLRLRARVQAHVRTAPPHGGTETLLRQLLADLDPVTSGEGDDTSVVVVRRERRLRTDPDAAAGWTQAVTGVGSSAQRVPPPASPRAWAAYASNAAG